MRVQILQSAQNLLRDPNYLKLSHWTAALQLLQNRATFSGLHEEIDTLLPQQCAIQFSDVLMTEPGLDLYICWLEVLQRDLCMIMEIRKSLNKQEPIYYY